MKKIVTSVAILSSFFAKGQSWVAQTSNVTSTLNAVAFVSENTGIAVGDAGVVLKTENGGLNWVKKTTPFTTTIYDVAYVTTDTVIAAVSSKIGISYDGGETWSNINSASGRTILSLNVKNKVCYLTTSGGNVEVSKDMGKTWANLFALGWNNMYGFDKIGDTSVFVGSKPATYAYSTDNGKKINTVNLAQLGASNMRSCELFNGKTALFTSQLDKYFVTRDGFATLDTVNIASFFTSPLYINALDFESPYKGYVIGASGLYYTSDAGKSWKKESAIGVTDMAQVDNVAYVVGYSGAILKKEYATLGVEDSFISEEIGFSPNPTTNRISFKMAVRDIQINDLSGSNVVEHNGEVKEISVLDLKAGFYLLKYELNGKVNVKHFIKE